MEGRIKLHRKIIDNPIYKSSQLFSLFIRLLLQANYKKDNIFYLKSEKIIQQPGELIFSQKKYAEQNNISIGSVNKYLNILKSESIIETRGCSKYTVVIIKNREKYQIYENRMKTEGKQNETIKKDNKEKNIIQYKKELENYIEKRNNVILKSKYNIKNFKQLPKIRKITPSLNKNYKKKRADYTIEELDIGLNKYFNDIESRKMDEGGYYNHRRSLSDFLSRERGLDKFVNL